MSLLVAAIRSAATFVAVSLYVLVAGPIGMLLALLFKWKSLLYVLGHAGVRLGLLLAYLAMPVDLIPDFIPILGYADDAIIVTVVLRSVVRRAGIDAVRAHWPGTDDGFTALTRLTGITGRDGRV